MQDRNEIRNNFTNLISCDTNAKKAFSDCEKFFDELTEWANKQTRYTYDKEDSTKNIKKSDSIPQCPGIYFAFEEEEKIIIGGNKEYYRIVRVGQTGKLKDRIKQHFRGNVNNSIFARLLSKALFYKNLCEDKGNTYLSFLLTWCEKESPYDPQLKADVGRYMQGSVSFVCLSSKDIHNETNCLLSEKTRLKLELNFTKILAKSWNKNIPSKTWLGNFVPCAKTLRNKLWCSNKDYASPCVSFPTKKEIDEMRDLIGKVTL